MPANELNPGSAATEYGNPARTVPSGETGVKPATRVAGYDPGVGSGGRGGAHGEMRTGIGRDAGFGTVGRVGERSSRVAPDLSGAPAGEAVATSPLANSTESFATVGNLPARLSDVAAPIGAGTERPAADPLPGADPVKENRGDGPRTRSDTGPATDPEVVDDGWGEGPGYRAVAYTDAAGTPRVTYVTAEPVTDTHDTAAAGQNGDSGTATDLRGDTVTNTPVDTRGTVPGTATAPDYPNDDWDEPGYRAVAYTDAAGTPRVTYVTAEPVTDTPDPTAAATTTDTARGTESTDTEPKIHEPVADGYNTWEPGKGGTATYLNARGQIVREYFPPGVDPLDRAQQAREARINGTPDPGEADHPAPNGEYVPLLTDEGTYWKFVPARDTTAGDPATDTSADTKSSDPAPTTDTASQNGDSGTGAQGHFEQSIGPDGAITWEWIDANAASSSSADTADGSHQGDTGGTTDPMSDDEFVKWAEQFARNWAATHPQPQPDTDTTQVPDPANAAPDVDPLASTPDTTGGTPDVNTPANIAAAAEQALKDAGIDLDDPDLEAGKVLSQVEYTRSLLRLNTCLTPVSFGDNQGPDTSGEREETVAGWWMDTPHDVKMAYVIGAKKGGMKDGVVIKGRLIWADGKDKISDAEFFALYNANSFDGTGRLVRPDDWEWEEPKAA